MWDDDSGKYTAVMNAELALLTSTVRADADHVRALLAPDFAEIGASGRRWSLDEIVAELSHEGGRMESETSEWLFNELAAGIVLVNYRVVTQGRESRRSSVWQVSDDGPVLRFHQGTIVSG